jgi:ribosomal protein S18 acetylase RimI-like enzyme
MTVLDAREAQPSVRRAVAADRDVVVKALVRAFDDDPVANFLLRQDKARARAFETGFDVAFRRLTLPLEEVWMSSAGEGAALWTPPKGWKNLRAWPNLFGLARAVGLARVPHVLAAVNRVQRPKPREPHWYLFALGVVPEAQGRGIGSALLRAVLARLDESGEPAYLEASTEDNARLYLRHGFRIVQEVKMAADGPVVRLMWRDPLR